MLDTTAYPHVLDAIVAAADRPALLALRTVNHALRARADAILAGSNVDLLITVDPEADPSLAPSPYPVVSGLHGRLPAFSPSSNVAQRWAELAPRVVTLNGAADLHHLPIAPKDRLIVRYSERRIHPNQVDEVAVGIDPRAWPRRKQTLVIAAPLPSLFEPTWRPLPRVKVPRIVINLSVHPDDTFAYAPEHHSASSMWGTRGLEWKLGAHADEIVWAFHRGQEAVHCSDGHEQPGRGKMWGADNMIFRLTPNIIDGLLGGAETSVAGLENLLSRPTGEGDEEEEEEEDEEYDPDDEDSIDGCANWIAWGGDYATAGHYANNVKAFRSICPLYIGEVMDQPEHPYWDDQEQVFLHEEDDVGKDNEDSDESDSGDSESDGSGSAYYSASDGSGSDYHSASEGSGSDYDSDDDSDDDSNDGSDTSDDDDSDSDSDSGYGYYYHSAGQVLDHIKYMTLGAFLQELQDRGFHSMEGFAA